MKFTHALLLFWWFSMARLTPGTTMCGRVSTVRQLRREPLASRSSPSESVTNTTISHFSPLSFVDCFLRRSPKMSTMIFLMPDSSVTWLAHYWIVKSLSPSNHQCSTITPLLSLHLVNLSSIFSFHFFSKLNLDLLFKDGWDSPNSWQMHSKNVLQSSCVSELEESMFSYHMLLASSDFQ